MIENSSIYNFLDVLKELMTLRGISARSLAKSIGVGDTRIDAWICGKYWPTTVNLLKLSDYFQCSVDYLLGISEDQCIPICNAPSDFISRLDLLMDKTGYSRNRLGKECGVYSATVSKWYRGKNPKPETLLKLALLFNCSVSYLLGRADSM